MNVGPFRIESEDEALRYLTYLLAKPEYRSMHEVELRAHKLIPNGDLRVFFIEKAKEMLEK